MTRRFASAAEFATAGEHLGWSSPGHITQDMVTRFCALTGDRRWIHLDPERAAATPSGGTVVPGFLTLSLLPRFLSDVYHVDGRATALNHGTERVRFPPRCSWARRSPGGRTC